MVKVKYGKGRTTEIRARVSPEEKRLFEAIAEMRGVTASDLIRAAIDPVVVRGGSATPAPREGAR